MQPRGACEKAGATANSHAGPRPTRSACLILVTAALALAAACNSGSGGNGGESRDDGNESASTDAKWSAEQRAALDAYDAFLAAVDKAMTEPLNPSEPGVAQHATADVAASVGLEVVGLQTLGQAIRPNKEFIPESVAVDGGTAQLEGCTVDRDVLYEVATGRVVDDQIGRFATTATLVLGSDGAWRVSNDAQQGNGTCEGDS